MSTLTPSFDAFNNVELLEFFFFLKSNTKAKEEVIGRSYLHPLNFYKLNLCRLGDTTIRIHYWLKNNTAPQNPHRHGWDFESKVLRGEICNLDYAEPVPSENGEYSHYKQIIENITLSYVMEKQPEKVNLTIQSATFLKSEDSYVHHHNAIHTTIACIDKTITVVKQGPFLKETCDVFTLTSLSENDKIPNMSIEEFDVLLDDIIGACNKGRSVL